MQRKHKVGAGLREAIAYAKGEPVGSVKPRVTKYRVPENIDVKKLRENLHMTQPEFALRFGFSLATVRQWEQGRRHPDGAARVLLTVIAHAPKTVESALEATPKRFAAVA